VKIGVQYQGDDLGPKAFAVRAEAAGFDSVWCGDHVGHLADGVAMLGCYAGATERITIGLNLLVVPYRPAAIAAKALATIALIAPGRVIAGFGVGGEFPGEFAATGADLRTRGAYTDDALEVIGRLWTGEPLTHHSRWASFDGFRLEPPPSPPPDVWVGGRSDAAMRRAVRFGAGYVPYLVSPAQLAKRVARLGEVAAEAGRPLDDFTFGCLSTVIPGPSVDAAVEIGLGSLRLSGLTPDSVRAHYLLGDDDAILAKLEAYAAAGADHVILGCLPGGADRVEEFFATAGRLLPAARALPTRRPAPELGAPA
jgi:alkanesulfonate monooxygenase SsuD/methylene tetrahydromethanopterin reductase-like flavin-dependent oxidoreductase (luciferase family)